MYEEKDDFFRQLLHMLNDIFAGCNSMTKGLEPIREYIIQYEGTENRNRIFNLDATDFYFRTVNGMQYYIGIEDQRNCGYHRIAPADEYNNIFKASGVGGCVVISSDDVRDCRTNPIAFSSLVDDLMCIIKSFVPRVTMDFPYNTPKDVDLLIGAMWLLENAYILDRNNPWEDLNKHIAVEEHLDLGQYDEQTFIYLIGTFIETDSSYVKHSRGSYNFPYACFAGIQDRFNRWLSTQFKSYVDVTDPNHQFNVVELPTKLGVRKEDDHNGESDGSESDDTET